MGQGSAARRSGRSQRGDEVGRPIEDVLEDRLERVAKTKRDLLVTDIERAGMATAKYQVTGVGPTLTGRNGGGDPYYTDGEVWILPEFAVRRTKLTSSGT